MTWKQLVSSALKQSPFLAFPREDLQKIEERRRSPRYVYVRFAYQWRDEQGNPRRGLLNALKQTVQDAFDEVVAKVLESRHKLDFRSLRAEAGTYLLRKIIVDLMSADLLFFDLTYRNVNVLFELGIAYAMGRRFFPIVRDTRIVDVPSDLHGLTIIPYRDVMQFSSTSALGDMKGTLREKIKQKVKLNR